MKHKWARSIAGFVGWVAVIYFVGSLSVYRFNNPHLTETELFLRIPDALMRKGEE